MKCPKCEAEIDFLNAYSLEEVKQKVYLYDGELDWSESDFVDGSCVRIIFECPNCLKEIYRNKGDSTDKGIIEILEGKMSDEKVILT